MRQPAATIVREVGNFGDDTRKTVMGIDPNNYGHLLSLLTDLYSDQILAVLREYSTNARDAHIEAGNIAPIEVTLPTTLSPYLVIRDFGIGMSGDDVIDTYSKYGSSTKRDSDDFNGMLGIGAKSALTYTNTFTIVSIKNGQKIIVSVSRNGNESTLEIVDLLATTEPNGVTVTIPVKSHDMYDFKETAAHLYSFWPEGSVLVNGVEPKRADLTQVTDRIFTTPNTYGHDIVVMGGVPYPAERRLYNGVRPYGNSFDVVAFVEIGEVAFTPSREALMYTKHTEATIESLRVEFAMAIQKTIMDDIESAPTHAEAYQRKAKWEQQYASVMPLVTYKGEQMPTSFKFEYSSWDEGGYRGGWQSGHQSINISTVQNVVLVHGFDIASLTKTHKEKIKQWKNKKGIVSNKTIFTENIECGPWIPKKNVVSWADIKAERLPSVANGGRGKQPIKVYDTSGAVVSMDDLDEDATPVYISPTARLTARAALKVYKVMPHVQIAILGENRWAKFVRENPKAIPLTQAFREHFATLRDALTAEDMQYMTMDYSMKNRYDYLDATRVDDPALADLIKIAKGEYKSPALEPYSEFVTIARSFIGIPDLPATKFSSLEYPLLPSSERGTLTTEHTYTYVNAVFAASIKE